MATMTTTLSPLRERRAGPVPFLASGFAALASPRDAQFAAELALAELFPERRAAADAALADLFPALRVRRSAEVRS